MHLYHPIRFFVFLWELVLAQALAAGFAEHVPLDWVIAVAIAAVEECVETPAVAALPARKAASQVPTAHCFAKAPAVAIAAVLAAARIARKAASLVPTDHCFAKAPAVAIAVVLAIAVIAHLAVAQAPAVAIVGWKVHFAIVGWKVVAWVVAE